MERTLEVIQPNTVFTLTLLAVAVLESISAMDKQSVFFLFLFCVQLEKSGKGGIQAGFGQKWTGLKMFTGHGQMDFVFIIRVSSCPVKTAVGSNGLKYSQPNTAVFFTDLYC